MASLCGYLKESLQCSVDINSTVIGSAPDTVISSKGGCIYEVKAEKIINSLYLNEVGKEISYAHIVENEKPLLVYVVLSSRDKLFIIKRLDSHLEVTNMFENVIKFEIYDFKLFGYPQIKITDQNKKSFYHFFVDNNKTTVNELDCENFQSIAKSLEKKLQIVCKHVHELTEEWYSIIKLCNNINKREFSANADCCNFSLPLKNNPVDITVTAKWFGMINQKLVYELIICNNGERAISDLQFKLEGKAVTEYTYRLFLHSNGGKNFGENPLFSSQKIISSIQPNQEVSVVVSASVDFNNYPFGTNLKLLCYLTSSKFKDYILKETFEVRIEDMIDAGNKFFNLLNNTCSVKLLQAIKTAKIETKIKIETKSVTVEHLGNLLKKKLNFVEVIGNGFKLYYCLSNLMEIIIAFQSAMICENFMNINLYAGEEAQIYFFLNALYQHLPECTIFLNED